MILKIKNKNAIEEEPATDDIIIISSIAKMMHCLYL